MVLKKCFGAIFCIATVFAMSTSSFAAEPQVNVEPAQKAPTIDGVLSEGEWGTLIQTLKVGEANTLHRLPDTHGFKKADIYVTYDANNFYVAVAAEYTDHSNTFIQTGDIWQGNAIQLMIAPTDKDPSNLYRNEIGFAMSTDGSKSSAFRWHPETRQGSLSGVTYKINRTGDITVYEVSMPWKALGTKLNVVNDISMYFSVTVNMGLQSGASAFVEYCSGTIENDPISVAKKTDGAPTLVLKKVEGATEESQEASQPESSSPADEPNPSSSSQETSSPEISEAPSIAKQIIPGIDNLWLYIAAGAIVLIVIAVITIIIIRKKKS